MMFQRLTIIVGYDETQSEKPSKWPWQTFGDSKTAEIIEAGNPRATAFSAVENGLIQAIPIKDPWNGRHND